MGSGASTWCFLDFVNLPFHEAGHLFFAIFGSTLHYLGGTLGQLAVPLLLLGYFLLRVENPFAAAFCLFWLGESLVNVSIYMADARELALPLVGGGDHDWNALFFRFGLLTEPAVERISTSTHFLGTAVMVLGVAWGGFFVLPGPSRERLRERATELLPWLGPALG